MSNIDHDALTIHQKDRHGIPLNAEVNGDELIRDFITPTDKIFHRNHDDIVQIPDAGVEEEWKVSITLDEDVAKQENIQSWSQSLSSILIPYGDMLHSKGKCQDVKKIQTTATLECAGNRREDLSEKEKTEGIQWSSGAISTANWFGISIRDLLINVVGVKDPYEHHRDALFSLQPSESNIAKDCAPWAMNLHLHMLSAQPTSESDQPNGEYFGASVPLSIALHPQQQCILATHQNDQILTQSHGFPVRVVIPGHIGARWVKWLRGLRISTKVEDSPPMRLDYKLLKPPQNEKERNEWKQKISGEQKDEDFRKAELNKTEPLQTLGVGSAIEEPKNDARIKSDSGKFSVKGYSVGQDGSQIAKVEVALLVQTEENETQSSLRDRADALEKDRWIQASLQVDTPKPHESENVNWAWTIWEAQLSAPSHESATFAVVARATTVSGVTQEKESDWNIRGFNTRSWPVVRGLKLEGV